MENRLFFARKPIMNPYSTSCKISGLFSESVFNKNDPKLESGGDSPLGAAA